MGRQLSEADQNMLALVGANRNRVETSGIMGNNKTRWNARAWDSYEYRANTPTLSQYDRDKSSRASRAIGSDGTTQLINLGTRLQTEARKRNPKTNTLENDKHPSEPSIGRDDGGSKPKKMKVAEA